ncbi:MAG: FxsA family protein [Sporichthyaceae bacterium]
MPVVVIALLLVPIIEIVVIVQVGQSIGAWPTIALLIASAVLGSWLIRREGAKAWTALRDKLHSGGMPAKELADGALILVGGTLLLTPGFLTDLVGFFLVLPFTRPLARRALVAGATRALFGKAGMTPPPGGPGGGDGGRVIRGDLIDPDGR